jgi:hypothetical protein
MLLGAVSTPVFPQIMARVGIVTQHGSVCSVIRLEQVWMTPGVGK